MSAVKSFRNIGVSVAALCLAAGPALAQQQGPFGPGPAPATGGGVSFPVNNVTVNGSQSASGNGLFNSSAGNQLNISLGGSAQNCTFTTGGLNNCVINPVNVQPISASNLQFTTSIKSASTGGVFWTTTNPTVGTGGFGGTAPTVTGSTGDAAFSFVVTASATSGTATLSFGGAAAAHGRACVLQDITTPASFVIGQTAVGTGTATFQVYSRTTGLAATITAGDVVVGQCTAY